jgi:hypothetical protein
MAGEAVGIVRDPFGKAQALLLCQMVLTCSPSPNRRSKENCLAMLGSYECMNVRLPIGQIVYFLIGLASLAMRVATKDEFDGCCGSGSHFPAFGSSPSIEAEDRPGIGSIHMRMTTLRLHHIPPVCQQTLHGCPGRASSQLTISRG